MPSWVALLPTLNALLNALSAGLLLTGFGYARRKRRRPHMTCMLAAVGVSVLFLVSYLTRHAFAGMTRFTAEGWVRPVYFALLLSHTLLAVAVVPLVLATLARASRGRIPAHVRLARWTFPIWLYVSVTGVLVYLMLYRWFPGAEIP